MIYLRYGRVLRRVGEQILRANCRSLLIRINTIRASAGSRSGESSRPLPGRFTTIITRLYSMVTTDELTARLSALSLTSVAQCAHPAISNPAEWKEALGQSAGIPQSFELCKTLVFKPKTAKTATPIPVVVIARDETETNSAALGKKFNLKELRLAADDLLREFFGLDKNSRKSSRLICCMC